MKHWLIFVGLGLAMVTHMAMTTERVEGGSWVDAVFHLAWSIALVWWIQAGERRRLR